MAMSRRIALERSLSTRRSYLPYISLYLPISPYISPHRVGAQLEHAQVLEALAVLDLTRRDRLRLHLVRVGVRVGIRVRVRVRVRIRVKG